MLKILDLKTDNCRGFKIIFTYDSEKDIIIIANIVRGLFSSIETGLDTANTKDSIFVDVCSKLHCHEKLQNIIFELYYDSDAPNDPIFELTTQDINNLEILNEIHDKMLGYWK